MVYGLQRLQLWLPLNPQRFTNVSPDSSFNTAVSFITNTNWQGYSGESTMSYLTQMAGLAVQNFPLGRDRNRGRDRSHSRFRTPQYQGNRQFLGRRDPCNALCAVTAFHRAGARAGLAGRPAEFQRLLRTLRSSESIRLRA
jgi:Potassium-transporting ATPase A subunit